MLDALYRILIIVVKNINFNKQDKQQIEVLLKIFMNQQKELSDSLKTYEEITQDVYGKKDE